jgi:DHA2 family multidrug resistance protein
MLFLNQAAIRSVPPSQAGDASGLYSAARNLGGSLALAAIAVIQDQRCGCTAAASKKASTPIPTWCSPASPHKAICWAGRMCHQLGATIQAQALTMTYADLFWLLGVAILCVTPLVLFLRPLPTNAAPVASH